MINDILRGLRDVLVLTERLAATTELAKQADRRSIELGERVARIEAVLDYAMRGPAARASELPSLPDRRP